MFRLRELRLAKNITMKKLGDDFGLAESTVSLYENEKRQPDFCTLTKLADYFNVSTDYLLGREEKSAPAPEGGLSDDEKTLLDNFWRLNEEGREKLLDYSDDLVHSGKYIKHDSSGLAQEA